MQKNSANMQESAGVPSRRRRPVGLSAVPLNAPFVRSLAVAPERLPPPLQSLTRLKNRPKHSPYHRSRDQKLPEGPAMIKKLFTPLASISLITPGTALPSFVISLMERPYFSLSCFTLISKPHFLVMKRLITAPIPFAGGTLSRRRIVSSSNRISPTAIFCSRCPIDVVPGMMSEFSECCRIHASPT